jgi:stage II sporulation protein D
LSCKKLIFKTTLIALSACIFIFLVGGCRLLTPEEPFKQGSETGLPLPPEIAQGERKEPIISVYVAEEGKIEQMGIEEYLEGVVAGEMDPNWPLEALAAQAIVARTFTLQKIVESGGVPKRNAHASTDIEEFQAYNAGEINDKVKKAVNMTRGKVVRHKNEFAKTWFHAYAGPRTALADEGLAYKENPPYIQIVESPGKNIVPSEEGQWHHSFTLDEVREAVREATGNDPGVIQNAEIKSKGPSGRATSIKINDQIMSAPEFRLALGSTEMRSTYLTDINIENGCLNLSGEGYGHGVGLCQWGARALAEQKKSPEEIINYFYKNINIVKLWE